MSNNMKQNQSTEFINTEERLLVDFINGLDVIQELLSVRKQQFATSSHFLSEMTKKITDDNDLSKTYITEHLLASLQACSVLLIEQENDSVLYSDILLKIKDEIEDIAQKTKQMMDRNSSVDQVNYWIDKWQAGGLEHFSALARCYWVLEMLYQGALGEYINQNKLLSQQILENVQDKLIMCLKKDLDCTHLEKISLKHWLRLPETLNHSIDVKKLLQEKGFWCMNHPEQYPLVFTATQWPNLSAETLQQYHHIPFNFQCIENIVKNMISEVFGRNNHD